MSAVPQAAAPRRRRSPLVVLPLVVFAGLAALFGLRLFAGDASRLPSALIGHVVPTFSLPPLDGLAAPGLASADLRAGHVTVVNVFASWCVPCRQEAAHLMALKAAGVPIVGIAYKDDPENARRFLGENGNPFARVGADRSGRAAIDWGVYGVPETYVVTGDGTIAYKFVGPLSAADVKDTLLPEIAKAAR